jgi:SAM-dependent methyltransferase
MPSKCPLCLQKNTEHIFYQALHRNREFLSCCECGLTFVNRSDLLSFTSEKERYQEHQNHLRTKGYEKFLRRIINPIEKIFPKSARGLDYGQGPYPMLQEIMNDDGYENVFGFDPHFANHQSVFDNKYDFIILSEVFEHMNRPRDEFDLLLKILNPGGALAFSTGILYSERKLQQWSYTFDETHINFVSPKTIRWMGERFSLDLIFEAKDIFIFEKK